MIRILALISIVAGIHFSLFAEPHIGLVDHYEILLTELNSLIKKFDGNHSIIVGNSLKTSLISTLKPWLRLCVPIIL